MTKSTSMIAMSLLVATIAQSAAHAESLEEKKYWKKQRNYIDEALKTAESSCGVKFAFDWIDAPTLRTEVEKTKHSPNGVCSNIIDEVASVCREGADEKAAVKAKITSFTCGYAADRSITIKGGVLTYKGNNVQPNFDKWAHPLLLKAL